MRRLSSLYELVSVHVIACAFVTRLPGNIRKLLCASSRMDALDFNQLLEYNKSIVKDDTPTVELIAIAEKPEQLATDLSCK